MLLVLNCGDYNSPSTTPDKQNYILTYGALFAIVVREERDMYELP